MNWGTATAGPKIIPAAGTTRRGTTARARPWIDGHVPVYETEENIMKSKLALIGLMTIMLAAPGLTQTVNAQQVTTKEQLIGTWKVLSFKSRSGNAVSYPFGEKVTGYVTHTPDRIWVLLVDPSRKAPASATLTDAESVEMMKTHVAWTSTYTLAEQTPDGLKVIAHVDAAPSEAINHTDRVVRVNGNRLLVKSNVINPATGVAIVAEGEFVKVQ
jgi:hypothetical protein